MQLMPQLLSNFQPSRAKPNKRDVRITFIRLALALFWYVETPPQLQ